MGDIPEPGPRPPVWVMGVAGSASRRDRSTGDNDRNFAWRAAENMIPEQESPRPFPLHTHGWTIHQQELTLSGCRPLGDTADRLRALHSHQQTYLAACYVRRVPPYSWPGTTARMRDSLRQMARFARQRGKRPPVLRGLLIPSTGWEHVEGGILVRFGAGRRGRHGIIEVAEADELVGHSVITIQEETGE